MFSPWSSFEIPELLDKLRDLQEKLSTGERMQSGSAVGQTASADLATWEQLQNQHDSLIVELQTRARDKEEGWETIPARILNQTAEQTHTRQSFRQRASDRG